jgi:transcriptional regulator with XRE-family HTH domain
MHSLAEIAEFLRAERTRQKLSQSEFAARAGIPLRSYQRLEAGDPGARISSFLRACAALGFEVNAASARRPTLDELDSIYGHEDER